MNGITLRYTVHFTSDWHIGTGAGVSGGVDRAVVRDRDGFPMIPAKTMTGVVRHEAEQLARALDCSKDLGWQRLVEQLFGSQPSLGQVSSDRGPLPALVSIRSAHHRPDLKSAIGPEQMGDLCVVRSSTAIDPETGTARRHTLRQIEVARAGSELVGEVTVPAERDDTGIVLDFLRMAFAAVTVIGGKRRRGLGACRVEFAANDDLASAADRLLANLESAPDLSHSDQGEIASADDPALATADEWHFLDLVIDLTSPVVIKTGSRGNVVESTDCIGGTQLLPLITALDPGIGVRRLVSENRFVLTPATPMIAGQRSVAVPLCFSRDKEADEDGHRNVVNSLAPKELNDTPTQRKQIRSGWVARTESGVAYSKVAVGSHSHAVIADDSQRPDETTGGLFTYEAIGPGQRFAARIGLRAARHDVERLRDALDEVDTALGTSRKDDYGRVRLTCRLVDEVSSTHGQVSEVLLLCASDVLVLGPSLRPSPTASTLARELARRLGLAADVVTVDRDGVRMRTRRIDGWHSQWNLPRPSLHAIAAGSVMRIRFSTPIGRDRLEELEREGLGERRAEGFGAVLFDPAVVPDSLTIHDLPVDPCAPRPSTSSDLRQLSDSERRFVNLVRASHQRRIIARTIDEFVSSKPATVELGVLRSAGLTSTQWNQLRAVLQASLLDPIPTLSAVTQWLDARSPRSGDDGVGASRKAARKGWEAVAPVILGWCNDPGKLWAAIKAEALDDSASVNVDLVIEALSDLCEKLARTRRSRNS